MNQLEQEDGYSIEHYSKEHNGLEFDCGDDAINDYFKRAADEHVSNNSTVYVCISKGSNQKELIGFFTLCSSKLYCKINGNQEKNHPCILLGQLGVNKSFNTGTGVNC